MDMDTERQRGRGGSLESTKPKQASERATQQATEQANAREKERESRQVRVRVRGEGSDLPQAPSLVERERESRSHFGSSLGKWGTRPLVPPGA